MSSIHASVWDVGVQIVRVNCSHVSFQITHTQESMASGVTRNAELEKKIADITAQMESQKGIIEQNNNLFYEKKREKDNLSNERK